MSATILKHTYVVVYGPPGTGKTTNAKAMMRRFECSRYVEHHDLRASQLPRGSSERILVLSNTPKLRDPSDRRRPLRLVALSLSVAEAARLCGRTWNPPQPRRVDF